MSEEAQTLYFQALKKHRQKEYLPAIELLRQALALDPEHCDSWEALGVLLEKTDQLDEAIEAMERLRDINPEEIMAHTNLSRFYMKKGWTERAEEAQGQARMLGWKQDLANPESSDFAQSEPEGSESNVAIASFLEDGTPSSPTATAGTPTVDPKELDDKIARFEAIVQVNGEDAMARLTLGKTLVQARRAPDAIGHLEKALEIQPEYSAVFVVLAQAYEDAGKLARAIKTLHSGIELAQKKGDLHPRNQMQEHLGRLTGSTT